MSTRRRIGRYLAVADHRGGRCRDTDARPHCFWLVRTHTAVPCRDRLRKLIGSRGDHRSITPARREIAVVRCPRLSEGGKTVISRFEYALASHAVTQAALAGLGRSARDRRETERNLGSDLQNVTSAPIAAGLTARSGIVEARTAIRGWATGLGTAERTRMGEQGERPPALRVARSMNEAGQCGH